MKLDIDTPITHASTRDSSANTGQIATARRFPLYPYIGIRYVFNFNENKCPLVCDHVDDHTLERILTKPFVLAPGYKISIESVNGQNRLNLYRMAAVNI